MATVTYKRIDQVYNNLTKAVIDTPSSETPLKKQTEEQNRSLAENCRQVCDLLEDWLKSDVWNSLRASAITNFAKDQQQFDSLFPTLQDVLERAGGHLKKDFPKYVGEAREALRAAADRDQLLFQKAEDKVGELKGEICELAALLSDRNAEHDEKTKARVRARKLLNGVIMLLPSLVMAMAGVSPSQAGHNLTQWGQEALKVIVIQDITARAELPDRLAGVSTRGSGIGPKEPGIVPAPDPATRPNHPKRAQRTRRVPNPKVERRTTDRGQGKTRSGM